MKITKTDLRWAASTGVLEHDQVEPLWSALEGRAGGRSKLTMVQVALYFGALIITGAMGWFVTTAWEELGGGGLLLVSGAYAAAFFLVGRHLWNERRMRAAGGILLTVAVSLTPLIVYAAQRVLGIWPQQDPGAYSGFHVWVRGGWVAMEVATIAAAVAVVRSFRFPFLMAPLSVALWYLSMDLAPLIGGTPRLTGDERAWVSVIVGLLILLGAYLIDRRTEEDFAFWLYLFGLLAFWGGLSTLSVDDEAAMFFYFVLNLLLMAVAVLLQRPVFMVFGALGCFFYLGHLAWEVFSDSVAFPFVLASAGVVVIFLAVKYQQNASRIDAAISSWMPPALARLLPRARTGTPAGR